MYCQKCSKQIDDNSKFCVYCGAPVNSNQAVSVQNSPYAVNNVPLGMPAGAQGYVGGFNRGNLREQEINEVRKMLNYFSLKTEQYNEYDSVCREFLRLKSGRRIAAIAWGCILTIAGGILTGFAIISAFSKLFNGYFNSAASTFLIALLTAVFLVLPGILLIMLDKKKIRVEYNQQLTYYTNRYYDLSDELYNHYLNYKNCPIGPEYTNPSNIQVILDTIVSGRADSTKEALNVLVEDAHRNRMENYAAQAAQYAQQAAKQAGRAAAASNVGAIFSAANYFQVRDFIRR